MPKFSIIIPVYNKAAHIADCLRSALHQSFTDFEILILNDGATDSSEVEIKKFSDTRIRYFSEENRGVSAARNYLVEKAAAPYIAFLDADDIWKPNHLEVLQELLLKFPNTKWMATAYEKQHSTSSISTMNSPILEKGSEWAGQVDDFFQYSRIDALAWTSAVAMKKDFFETLGGFNTEVTHGEDTDLWIRAALQAPLTFSNQVTALHVLHSTNRSAAVTASRRKFPDLDVYKSAAEKNSYLAQYLSLNHYAIALHYKMEGNSERFQLYRQKIDDKHLTAKQRSLLTKPRSILLGLQKVKALLQRMGIPVSTYT
ncbi:glycosyltransferase family A protein [Luteirhabdus pelagi]|uniref:glycosyltransferase family A protein n=1 Tax=Luteirhabdus pelagi TaxID=2792783 RepID=UPI00193A894D|nr:glycosyltransferase family A protein [Luteirhabdus pelagi]